MISWMKTVSRWTGLLVASLALTACLPHRLKNDFIIHGGDVVTMDNAGTVAEAVWVRNGRIEAVGPREEVMRHKTKTTELIDLHGGALLPGFVEPHLHLDVTASMSVVTDLTPCLPDRYETRKSCPVTILAALDILKQNPKPAAGAWLVGNGLDPSLMTLDGVQPSSVFHANPAPFIAQEVSAAKPVIILDKSGHLAYVNLQAFVAAGICETTDNCTRATARKPLPPSPGQWPVDDSGVFTGLLVEPAAYKDFGEAMVSQDGLRVLLPLSREVIDHAGASIRDFARAGVTTMVNGGTGPDGWVDLFRMLASRSGARPLLRFRTLVPLQAAAAQKPSPWDEKDDGLFGVTGIKVWADGSTQGCTAALIEPYDVHGQCGTAGKGLADYTTEELIAKLKPLWKAGWPIQLHVNGDQAILNALNALAALQADTRNDSPIVLIHFTIGGNPAKGEDMVKKVADLRAGRWLGKPVPPIDIRVSHLIGHVAYWGGALENILDGVSRPGQRDENGRAARLDATRHELELGVPFSLHSDSPVSPVRPLWYVEQAVTRNTWFYPKLTDADVHSMPGEQNITIDEALQAVTLEPARQNGLDRYIGSIEKGKVADLVILDKNPLKQPPNAIHLIRVLSTFVGGHRNDWSKE
jgi:predicted amidohydrolase YtcJ